jgi:hypothetical protein
MKKLTVFSSLALLGAISPAYAPSVYAQSYSCSDVALGNNTYERDLGYEQDNNGYISRADIQNESQNVFTRDNNIDTQSYSADSSGSQSTNNSGFSSSSNAESNFDSRNSSRSNSNSVQVGGNYGLFGASVGGSNSNNSSNSTTQARSASNSRNYGFNQDGSSQRRSATRQARDGSSIDEASINRTNYNNQSNSELYDQDRRQRDYTRTSTTVVGMNCDTAVQAESARDREMIRQRGAVEQERLRQQRNQMRQQSSDDFFSGPW